MFRRTDIFLIAGLLLIIFAICWFGIVMGSNMTNSTYNCYQMYQTDNWTLGYLRSLAAYCSNGGE